MPTLQMYNSENARSARQTGTAAELHCALKTIHPLSHIYEKGFKKSTTVTKIFTKLYELTLHFTLIQQFLIFFCLLDRFQELLQPIIQ